MSENSPTDDELTARLKRVHPDATDIRVRTYAARAGVWYARVEYVSSKHPSGVIAMVGRTYDAARQELAAALEDEVVKP